MKKYICLLLTSILIFTMIIDVLAVNYIRNGDREVNKICITVDDCFDMDIVNQFMDTAIENNIKLTFFVLGRPLKDSDDKTLYRMLDNDFEIGNHTVNHRAMRDWTPERISRELLGMEKKLEAVLGFKYKPNIVRFPYGIGGAYPGLPNYRKAMEKSGYEYSIYWDVVLSDAKTMLKQIKNGSIILLHSNKKDLRIFREMLPELINRGYKMVTVSELIGLEKVKYDR